MRYAIVLAVDRRDRVGRSTPRSRSGASATTRPGRCGADAPNAQPARSGGRAAHAACCRWCSTTRCTSTAAPAFLDRGALRRAGDATARGRCSASSRPQFAASKTSRRRSCSSWASACCSSRRSEPQFVAALRPLVAGDWLRNPVAYVLLFGVASPLVLYRGPLNPFGVGIAIFTVLLTAHVLPPVVLVAGDHGGRASAERLRSDEYAQTSGSQTSPACRSTRSRKRTLPYQTAVAIVGDARGRVWPRRRSSAGRAFALAHPGGARGRDVAGTSTRRLGARSDRGRRRRDAAGTGCRRCGRGRARRRTPGRRCAYTRSERERLRAQSATRRTFSSTPRRFALIEGDDLDVGLRLEDCGGWIVDEWHDHEVVAPPPTPTEARALAAARRGAAARAGRCASRFAAGIFSRAASPRGRAIEPTYFYAFFTSDRRQSARLRSRRGPGLRSPACVPAT